MKNRASVLLKQILSVITTCPVVKSRSMPIRRKISAIKTRIIIYSLLLNNNKKVLMSSISHQFNSLLGGAGKLDKEQQQQQQGGLGGEGEPNHDKSKAITTVLYNKAMAPNESHHPTLYELAAEEEEEEEETHDDDHKYPDLTHSLFEYSVDSTGEEELDVEDDGSASSINDQTPPLLSVIDLVRNSKEEEGESFRLEDEIDQVADLFIRRFHQQMRMQKQASFKRYQEMLLRSV